MRLQDVSYALKAAAEVAHAGEQLVGSLDRSGSRGRLGVVLVSVGLGVGLGALLFSESARLRVRTWLFGPPVEVHQTNGGAPVVDANDGHRAEAAARPH